jgi:hypothetical protein
LEVLNEDQNENDIVDKVQDTDINNLELENEIKKIKVIQELKQNRKQEHKHRMEKAVVTYQNIFSESFANIKKNQK